MMRKSWIKIFLYLSKDNDIFFDDLSELSCYIDEHDDIVIDSKKLLDGIKKFIKDSVEGKYYKKPHLKVSNVSEETDRWIMQILLFFLGAGALSKRGDDKEAFLCFKYLLELLYVLDCNEKNYLRKRGCFIFVFVSRQMDLFVPVY